jgi:hypothetical protein
LISELSETTTAKSEKGSLRLPFSHFYGRWKWVSVVGRDVWLLCCDGAGLSRACDDDGHAQRRGSPFALRRPLTPDSELAQRWPKLELPLERKSPNTVSSLKTSKGKSGWFYSITVIAESLADYLEMITIS